MYYFSRVTVIVLIVESRWTESPRRKFIIEKNSTCYEHEDYKIIQDCHPCTGMLYQIKRLNNQNHYTIDRLHFIHTDSEITSKSQGVCVHTHNKEVLRCKSGKTVTRRCIFEKLGAIQLFMIASD